MKFYKTSSVEVVAGYLADTISGQLKRGKKVLWLAGGGSGIDVAIATSRKLKNIAPLENLTFTLTDERFGPVGHPDSNWLQLERAGLSLPASILIPVLNGKDIKKTTSDFGITLRNELETADYKIGLFGMGADGHTAGILPFSPGVSAKDLVVFYKTPEFERITITFQATKQLDEAVLYAMGEPKHPIIERLDQDIAQEEQPAQILKQIHKFRVYNDYKGEEV